MVLTPGCLAYFPSSSSAWDDPQPPAHGENWSSTGHLQTQGPGLLRRVSQPCGESTPCSLAQAASPHALHPCLPLLLILDFRTGCDGPWPHRASREWLEWLHCEQEGCGGRAAGPAQGLRPRDNPGNTQNSSHAS